VVRWFPDADDNPDSHQNQSITFWPFTMFSEICMQIYSVVFAISRQINKQNYAKTINLLCAGNKVFVKYQVQGGFNPKPPLRTPLLITSATKCDRGIYTFHWILVAPQELKSVLPVEDSFSNKEKRTFSRIRANQSTSKTFTTSLWRRKTKPASLNYFAIMVLATNKTCSTFPWQVSVFSVLWNITF